MLAPGSYSDENLITSLKGFFTNSGYRFSVPAIEFRSAFPQLADAFDVDSLPSLSTKMSALSIDTQKKKDAKRQTKKSKVKKVVMKSDIGPLDLYLQSNRENEASGVTVQTLSPWDSPLEKSLTGDIR